jgi:hypothetical protein
MDEMGKTCNMHKENAYITFIGKHQGKCATILSCLHKDLTVSALATDNRSFIVFTTYFNLTPTCSSQQSEVTTADVFSYKTITQNLPPLGATAKVEFFSITDVTFSFDFLLPCSKR